MSYDIEMYLRTKKMFFDLMKKTEAIVLKDQKIKDLKHKKASIARLLKSEFLKAHEKDKDVENLTLYVVETGRDQNLNNSYEIAKELASRFKEISGYEIGNIQIKSEKGNEPEIVILLTWNDNDQKIKFRHCEHDY